MQPEARLTRRIIAEIKRRVPTAYLLKIHGSPYQTASTDFVACIGGRFIAVEVKHPKPGESRQARLDRVTDRQQETIARVREAGGIALVMDSVADVDNLMRLVFDT